jgi:hypothetical protein
MLKEQVEHSAVTHCSLRFMSYNELREERSAAVSFVQRFRNDQRLAHRISDAESIIAYIDAILQ